jgi:UDP-3-O-[3-hydroxymyristoyl] glucosamine N-acyltransferase
MDPSPYYSSEELRGLGATSVGRNVKVSRLARFYEFSGAIGDYSRIDDFCTLKGTVEIGAMVHIATYCLLAGSFGKISFGDFSGVAAYVGIYTASSLGQSSDLFANPTAPEDLQGASITGDVLIGKGAGCGSHCLILPGTILEDYVGVGAHCIITGRLERGGCYISGAGRLRKIHTRDLDGLAKAEAEAYRRLKLEL